MNCLKMHWRPIRRMCGMLSTRCRTGWCNVCRNGNLGHVSDEMRPPPDINIADDGCDGNGEFFVGLVTSRGSVRRGNTSGRVPQDCIQFAVRHVYRAVSRSAVSRDQKRIAAATSDILEFANPVLFPTTCVVCSAW